MKATTVVCMALGFALLTAASASAFVPYASFWSGHDPLTKLPLPVYEDEKGIWRLDTFEYSTREYTIKLTGVTLDPDPLIAYGIAVIDFNAPSEFSFSFFTPIVPTGSPNSVKASLSGTLVDLLGDGASITPGAGTHVQSSELMWPRTNMGVDVGPGFSAAAGAPGAMFSYGPDVSGPSAGPGPGPWLAMQTNLDFTLSGHGDMLVLQGCTRIVEGATPPVPEPLSVLLLGGGLLAAGIARARRGA